MSTDVCQRGDDAYQMSIQTKNRTQPSYPSNYKFLQKIDSLPMGPEWKCETIKVTGDTVGEDGKVETELVELWCRDPTECIKELIGNPAFRENMSYAPQKVFTSGAGTTRIYDEAWTGDWWWTMQVRNRLCGVSGLVST
jgi:hypothetical protein